MKIDRLAARLDRRRRKPRFRAPAAAFLLAALFAAGLLVSLNHGAGAPPSPPAPAFLAPTAPAPSPPPAPPPTALPADPAPSPGPGCPQGCDEPRPGCLIKGNLSQRTGERIYHLPGQRYYAVTVIDPAAGERWFCTEAEARANGWRKSKR
jgi:hypothetical protein